MNGLLMNMLMPCPVYSLLCLVDFTFDSLREPARLYIEHAFITEDADTFMAEVPTISYTVDEPQAHVTNQLLGDPDSNIGDLLPSRPSFNLSEYQQSFTESQYRAFHWISSRIGEGKQVQAAIIGPAGTGKSYLLQALIKQMRSQSQVVCKWCSCTSYWWNHHSQLLLPRSGVQRFP